MRTVRRPSTGRRYPLTMISAVFRVARSSGYATPPSPPTAEPGKRGPQTRVSDADVLAEIRAVLAASPFHGEGYRTSITDRPDVMWGTDGTRFYTEREGWCWFFGAIDHHTDELLGWHVVKLGDRWAALEPIRQGVRHAFGGFGKDIARGLRLRCNGGPQYIADAWINAVKWLGITLTPSYVGAPQCNGVAERFMRTLTEQCVYLHHFESVEQARAIIAEFVERYNTQWLIERLGHRTPAQARAEAVRRAA